MQLISEDSPIWYETEITVLHKQVGKYVNLGEVQELKLEFTPLLTDSLLSELPC